MPRMKVLENVPQESRTDSVKIILLGDSAVGKSKLVERFLLQRYIPLQMSTYALTTFRHDYVDLDTGKTHHIDIWDTAGQERFSAMHPAYYHDTMCCILVFDATRKPTYKNLQQWLQELRTFREHIPCIVCCNKIDEVPDAATKSFAFAERHGFPLIHCSAADGTNVVSLFETAIDLALEYRKNVDPKDFVTQVLDIIRS